MRSLFEAITDKQGVTHRFAGLLPGRSIMQSRLAALGTQFIDLPEGHLAGHTFHYSRSETPLTPIAHARTTRDNPGEAVFRLKRLTASYIHLYFPSHPAAIADLLSKDNTSIFTK